MSILEPDRTGIREAADTIRSGYIIGFPTETFYGLGADPFNPKVLKELIKLKKRPAGKPISILIPDIGKLSLVAKDISPLGMRLINAFWPGPLTLVFKAIDSLPEILTGGTGKIGVRVSSHPVAAKLLEYLNTPVTATSANLSGDKEPLTAQEVDNVFGNSIAFTLNGGKLSGKKGSTVIDTTGNGFDVLRKGEISLEEIRMSLK